MYNTTTNCQSELVEDLVNSENALQPPFDKLRVTL